MINSRKIEDLHPIVREKAKMFLARCKKELPPWVEVLIISTHRDNESQAELYAQGRTKPGKIVTMAKPGQSFHNWRVALDILPLRHGKPVWETSGDGIDTNPADDEKDSLELWQRIVAIAESCGLESASRWKKFKEWPHLQYTGGLTLADFLAGKILGGTAK